ncbi:hypothetical protein VCV18_005247 [Metarhizium anisopliae]
MLVLEEKAWAQQAFVVHPRKALLRCRTTSPYTGLGGTTEKWPASKAQGPRPKAQGPRLKALVRNAPLGQIDKCDTDLA